MATSGNDLKMSEETFDYICSACAEDDLIKQALKYCIECQQYCCKDCLTYHRRFASFRGHSFLDNTSVKAKGQPKSLPALPTKQCSKHIGKLMDMYCQDEDAVCCYVCSAEDHKSCNTMMSVSDNINQLYNKNDTSKVTSKLSNMLDDLNQWKTNTNSILQQLGNSKTTAIKAVKDYRIEMENILKKMEETSIKEIEDEYKKLETQILEERKRFEDYIDDLKNLQQLFSKASGNIAQLFVCTKLAEKKCTIIGDNEMKRKRFQQAEVKFLPSDELQSSMKKKMNLGEASSISSSKYNKNTATKHAEDKSPTSAELQSSMEKMVKLGEASPISTSKNNMYTATKIHDIYVIKEGKRRFNNSIIGSCIMADEVIFSDYWNNKLKRYDISSSSQIDFCKVPEHPRGICKITDKQVAVACQEVVQFVSVNDKLSLTHSIQMKHNCYGLGYNDKRLYITDAGKSLYMYDMSGNLLKTVTTDSTGQSLFGQNNHITFNDKNDRLFVGDDKKGLVCFNADCEYIRTLEDPDVRPDGVCTDGYSNIIVANFCLNSIVQCDREGQKYGVIANTTRKLPRCVCIHHGLRRMFVGYSHSSIVDVYQLT